MSIFDWLFGRKSSGAGRVIPPAGWTSEDRRVTVATPEGDLEKEITYYVNSIGMEFVLIRAGEFMMGSPDDEEDHEEDEGPVHKVRIASPFFLGATPVTQAQYEQVVRENPSYFKGSNRPAEYVSWKDAVDFCKKLSEKEGSQYRLATEAEWEYACRAGTSTPFYFGATISTDQANYEGNYPYGNGHKGVFRKETTDVGGFAPNAFGLYDMHGNVWEWCQSLRESYPYQEDDGREDLSAGGSRVLRGGAWGRDASWCRSAMRSSLPPTYSGFSDGVRVVAVVRRQE